MVDLDLNERNSERMKSEEDWTSEEGKTLKRVMTAWSGDHTLVNKIPLRFNVREHKLKTGLIVVSHKLELKSQVRTGLYRVANVNNVWFRASHTPAACKPDRPNKCNRSLIGVNPCDLLFVSAFFPRFNLDYDPPS